MHSHIQPNSAIDSKFTLPDYAPSNSVITAPSITVLMLNVWGTSDLAAARKSGYTDDDLIAFAPAHCIKECAAASWWERTFGECKTD